MMSAKMTARAVREDHAAIVASAESHAAGERLASK
jgi:hypothetical protein